jgi:hypothetical protein
MAISGRRGGSSGRDERDRDRGDRDHERYPGHEHEGEEYDNPREHLEIERRRFAGGLQPTPELYALARKQWYRLPGVFVRPSMDTVPGDTAGDATPPTSQPNPSGKEPGQ